MSDTAITPKEGAATEAPVFVPPTKEEWDKAKKDIVDARILQGQADARADRLHRALTGTGKGGSNFVAPGAAPVALTEQEKQDYAAAEDRKAAQGLQRLALDPAFREALDADPTLRGLFTDNPLAVLPLLAPAAFDAEDAVTLVKQALTERATKLKTTVIAPKVEEQPVVVAVPVVVANSTPVLDAEYEEARKRPNIESALVGMIGTGLKKLGSK